MKKCAFFWDMGAIFDVSNGILDKWGDFRGVIMDKSGDTGLRYSSFIK